LKHLFFLFLLISSNNVLAGNRTIFIPTDSYLVKTQEGLIINEIKIGLRCKLYSKIRILGSPVSIRTHESPFFTESTLRTASNDSTIMILKDDTSLIFYINNLTSYIHACSFLFDVKAKFKGDLFEAKSLHLGDFTVDEESSDVSSNLSKVLNLRYLKINKYTKQLNFQR